MTRASFVDSITIIVTSFKCWCADGHVRRMVKRTAKNDTVHTIWLKFSRMLRLIGPSLAFIVGGMI